MVKSVKMNILHVNNRSGALYLPYGRLIGYPAWAYTQCIPLVVFKIYEAVCLPLSDLFHYLSVGSIKLIGHLYQLDRYITVRV